tara:strand:- start:218 stop:532 length:315 start_codon:yes stop_codon:yes gene_type:complete
MKNIVIASIVGLSALYAGSTNAEYMDPILENKLVKICHAIKSDSRIKLHVALKKSGIRVKSLAKGLVCNGYDPVTFAALNNANRTGTLMANKFNLDYQELLAKL